MTPAAREKEIRKTELLQATVCSSSVFFYSQASGKKRAGETARQARCDKIDKSTIESVNII